MTSLADRFESEYGFSFDDFQRRAVAALAGGSSVLVAAPTGAGKTVVGEFAAALALEQGGKTFYTTPIKALSNQKYGDFVGLHGASNVGLLTGDNSINGDAPVVVMTTEVLRNMLYEDSPTLRGLRFVVLDEVHYLQNPYRGAVWEEVLIHLPVDVLVVSLSATVSNAEEFAEWLQTIRGRTEVIIEETRPVDIRHWYFAGDELLPMFVHRPDGEVIPNPRGRDYDRRRRPAGAARPGPGGRRPRDARRRAPYRTDVVERLAAEGMLPGIYFIFSRRGCDEAVRQCLRANVRLTNAQERAEIVAYAQQRIVDLSPQELDVLGYDDWIAGLAGGIAAHHAGMIPPFKEAVEELFARGLVKIVFATETLALGINMPARSVTIENLTKFTGERHELMTPGEYTQLSGRAGRRGIDELGHCVVLLQRFTPFETITRLASTRTYPLQSSFQPSYNMAVNLVRNYDRHDAEHLVNSSFAQFQADRDVVRLERQRERSETYLASYRERMRCDRGDFEEYRQLVDKLRRAERGDDDARTGVRSVQVAEAMGRLRPGDVIDVTHGRRRGRYAVLEVPARSPGRQPRVLAVSEARSMIKFAPSDFLDPPRSLGRLSLPKGFMARDARVRRHIARQLASFDPSAAAGGSEADGEPKHVRALRRKLEAHPCHGCPDRGRHLHYAERAARLQRELTGLDRRINRRTGTLARRFQRVLEVLETRGYVRGWEMTDEGHLLARVYNESDLLVVEALERGLFEGLDEPEAAALCSALVYETRGPDAPPAPDIPTARLEDRLHALLSLWRGIHEEEERRDLELTREPDPGFVMQAYLWADGARLDEVLGPDDAPGDFVRSTKQLVDLLRQLVEIAPSDELADVFAGAVERLQRGVVAYSSLDV